MGDLRDQGFPIAYDKQAETYYYSEPVKIEFSILVGQENLMTIRGGKKKLDVFSGLPDFGREGWTFVRLLDLLVVRASEGVVKPGIFLPSLNPGGRWRLKRRKQEK